MDELDKSNYNNKPVDKIANIQDYNPVIENPTSNNTQELPIFNDRPPSGRQSKLSKLKRIFKSKLFFIFASIAIIIIIAVVVFVEPIKFAVLNLVTDGSAEFIVIDDTTLSPIENAKITIGGNEGKTNKDGKTTLKKLKFGTISYIVSKEAYNNSSKPITIRPGNNFVGPVKLHSDGIPFTVTVINKLSKEKINDFKISVDGSKISALSDGKGSATIKIPPSKLGEVVLNIASDGFIDSQYKANITKATSLASAIELVPTGKHFFLSNRNGKIAVYSTNIDGSNQTEIIAGAENDDNTQLSIAPDGKYAALVSKRNGQKDAASNVLRELFAIDLEQNTIKRIVDDTSVSDIIGWANNNQFLYMTTYGNWERADNMQIKSADIVSAKSEVLYSQKSLSYYFTKDDPSHLYINNQDKSIELYGLISLDLKTKTTKRLFNSLIYQIKHTTKLNALAFVDEYNKWHELNTKTQQVTDTNEPVGDNISLAISPSSNKTAWIEDRDGKGSIIVANSTGGDQKQVTKDIDISSIISWTSEDYIIFYTQTASESAQYIVHIPSGTATKISDVYAFKTYANY